MSLPTLSIVVPAYNEEQRLPPTLETILGYFSGKPHWQLAEVLVVNDGSRDATARVAGAVGQPVRVLENPGNRGKGYSIRHGMLEAAGSLVLSTDADLSSPIEEIEKLWSAMERAGADIAIGSRALDRRLIERHQPVLREYMGRMFNLVVRTATGLSFRDTQCGFKLFRKEAARQVFGRQQLNGFGFDVEDLFIARLLGLKIVEVPVRWSNAEGTKVTLLHGLDAFIDIARVRWNQVRGRYSS